jgi:ribosomal protein S18 acetylase RimI-like enzyme
MGQGPSGNTDKFVVHNLPTELFCHVLDEQEWARLRNARLTALRDDPESFLSRYETEMAYSEARWRNEFTRGTWVVLEEENGAPAGLVGIVKSSDISSSGRYIEYLWISPRRRRSGLASSLLEAIREYLSMSGITTIWLWVLNGNEEAWNLYEKHGFITTHKRQPLRDRPDRYEERMKLTI